VADHLRTRILHSDLADGHLLPKEEELRQGYDVDHIDMPCTPDRVWAAMQGRPEPPQ